MSTQQTGLDAALGYYLYDVTLREPSILRSLREETRKLPGAHLQISPEQGQFMRLLVELLGAKRCLEIGVYTGYSSLSIALGLGDDGLLIACDIDAETTAIAKRYWALAQVEHKVKLELGPATDTLRKLIANGTSELFDFAFIDADKTGYDEYYELCLVLLRKGGLIALDNAFWNGKVVDSSVSDDDTLAIRALNRKVSTDLRVTSSLVPIGDGLLLARKR
jgi:caffeoyl-CoA O-methyltransferase